MPTLSSQSVANQLLATLPNRVRRDILRQCTAIELTFGEILQEPYDRIRYVYFPTGCFISVLATVGTAASVDASLEVGMIGAEGVLGIPSALGATTAPLRALVQGTGGAWRMSSTDFKRTLIAHPSLRRALDVHIRLVLAQLAQTAVCTCFHVLDARLARWLLMTHDHAQTDQFYLTHALLAAMLGVRRSGISTAAAKLQKDGLIRYHRGHITICDRAGLERASCECYRVLAART